MNGASRGHLVWVASELSEAGKTVLGVFTTLEAARAALPADEPLDRYAIEGHVLDEGREAAPWQVSLSRDGDVLDIAPFIGCSCEDDEPRLRALSFIERGGERMHLCVLAVTPGRAVHAAQDVRAWLQAHGAWSDEGGPLEPIDAG